MSSSGIYNCKDGVVDRRRPDIESRRLGDCFPNGGAVAIGIGAYSFVSLIVGIAIGAWLF